MFKTAKAQSRQDAEFEELIAWASGDFLVSVYSCLLRASNDSQANCSESLGVSEALRLGGKAAELSTKPRCYTSRSTCVSNTLNFDLNQDTQTSSNSSLSV